MQLCSSHEAACHNQRCKHSPRMLGNVAKNAGMDLSIHAASLIPVNIVPGKVTSGSFWPSPSPGMESAFEQLQTIFISSFQFTQN